MTLNLPPRAAFTQKETLHAIELPPLATFLTTLNASEHIIKLNDILLRYRTPKSYHRVDVREVSSSEIPLSSPEPESEGNDGTGSRARSAGGYGLSLRSRKRRRKEVEQGEPIELDEGVDLEEYKARRDAGIHVDSEATCDFQISANGGDPASTGIIDTLLTSSATPQQSTPLPTSTTVKTLNNPTSPPTATHHLPPSGPKRRIRELRVDLRSLDAAALFTLETWRREVLGLEKLNMEHPDSIWYKDPTPTPTPSPEPIPVSVRTGGRPGRPRKKSTTGRKSKSMSKTPQLQVLVGEEGMEVDDLDSIDTPHNKESEIQPEAEIEDSGKDRPQDIEAFDTLVDSAQPVDDQQTGIDSLEKTADPVQVVEETSLPSPDSKAPEPAPEASRPPSPDVLLVDGFNVDEENDPDFAPEPSPEPVKRKERGRGRAKEDAIPGPSSSSPIRTMNAHSAFEAAPLPAPMQLGINAPHASISRRFAALDNDEEEEGEEALFLPGGEAASTRSASPIRRISISPTRPGGSPTREPAPFPSVPMYQPGQSSDSAILIPDSPEKRPQSAFVPFVREPMRLPTYSHAPVESYSNGYGEHYPQTAKRGKSKSKAGRMEIELQEQRARGRKSSSRVRFEQYEQEGEDEVEEVYHIEDDDVVEIYEVATKGKQKQIGTSDEDDEWDSFRF